LRRSAIDGSVRQVPASICPPRAERSGLASSDVGPGAVSESPTAERRGRQVSASAWRFVEGARLRLRCGGGCGIDWRSHERGYHCEEQREKDGSDTYLRSGRPEGLRYAVGGRLPTPFDRFGSDEAEDRDDRNEEDDRPVRQMDQRWQGPRAARVAVIEVE